MSGDGSPPGKPGLVGEAARMDWEAESARLGPTWPRFKLLHRREPTRVWAAQCVEPGARLTERVFEIESELVENESAASPGGAATQDRRLDDGGRGLVRKRSAAGRSGAGRADDAVRPRRSRQPAVLRLSCCFPKRA